MGDNGGVINVENDPTFTLGSGMWRPSRMARRMRDYLGWPLLQDPNFSSVVYLLHFDEFAYGSNLGLLNRGSSSALATLANAASLTSSFSRFGQLAMAGAASTSSTAYITVADSADFDIASGTDFTLEVSVYGPGRGNIIDMRTGGTSISPQLSVATTGSPAPLRYLVSGAAQITGTTDFSAASSGWYHLAIARASGTTKMFVNGTQEGSNYTDSNSYVANGVGIGNGNQKAGIGGSSWNGSALSEFRFTKGVARYTSNFTPPTNRFPDY